MKDIRTTIHNEVFRSVKFKQVQPSRGNMKTRSSAYVIATIILVSILVCLSVDTRHPAATTLPGADPRARLPGPQVSLGGVEEWTRRWDFSGNPDIGAAIATNGTEFIYLAGTISQNEAFLAKCDASGTILWNRTWGGSGVDKAFGVATDKSGYIYLAGYTESFGAVGGRDAFLAKYDPSGTSLWNRTWVGAGDNEIFYDVATDGSGYVYLTGEGAVVDSGLLAKYDSSGTSLWNRTLVGVGYGVATDGSGNTYIAVTDTILGNEDAYLLNYDSSGTQQWNRTYNGFMDDFGRDVAVDGSGNVYFTGYTFYDAYDVFLSKYDPSGTSLWNRTWAGPETDFGIGVSVDANGNAYIAGSSDSFTIDQQGILLKYDPSGTLLWNTTQSFDGNDVATVGGGIVYYAGNDNLEAYLTKFTHVAPPITINAPSGSTRFHAAPQFNVTVADSERNASWYAVGPTGTNRSFTPDVLTQVNTGDWDAQPEGPVTLRFWANDTEGDLGYAEVTVIKDLIAPLISITLPAAGQLCNATAPSFSLAITETYLDEIWYSLDNGATNTTCGATGDLAAQWGNRPNGTVTATFWVNDTAGNDNASSVAIERDVLGPIFTSTGFSVGQIFGVPSPAFVLAISEANLDDTWYSLDGGATNTTCELMGTLSGQWAGLPNGSVIVTFWANDSLGNSISTSITIWKDNIAPIMALNTPLAGASFFDAPSFALTSCIDINLDKIWYTLGTDPTPYFFTELSEQINAAAWTAQPAGQVTIHFYANDTGGNVVAKDVVVVKLTWMEANYLYVIAVGATIGVIGLVTRQRKQTRARNDAWFQTQVQAQIKRKSRFLAEVEAGMASPDFSNQVVDIIKKFPVPIVSGDPIANISEVTGVVEKLITQKQLQGTIWNNIYFADVAVANFVNQFSGETPALPLVDIIEMLHGIRISMLSEICRKLIDRKLLQGTVWQDIYFADQAVARMIKKLSEVYPSITLKDLSEKLANIDRSILKQIVARLVEQQKIRVKFDLHSEVLTLQAKIDEAAIKKLNGIIRIDKRVDLNKAQEVLSIPKEDVRNLIYEIAGEGHIEGSFEGDVFVIQSDVTGFINELNRQFQVWDKAVDMKEKKV